MNRLELQGLAGRETEKAVLRFTHEKENMGGGLRAVLDSFEREYILEMLEKNQWNKVKTARMLAIPHRTLYRKLNKHKLIM